MPTPIPDNIDLQVKTLLTKVDAEITANAVDASDSTPLANNKAASLIYYTALKTYVEGIYDV